MASEREIFCLSGPLHLTAIDWNNAHHRRSIAASLVKGAYVVELDRQQNRQGSNALAPPWWEFFNFELIRVLVDTDDSFFGCIYELKIPYPYCGSQNPPKYVIAFRGTVKKPDTWLQDVKLGLQWIRLRLHERARFQRGMQAVEDMVARAGAGNVWLAGHSLGSAIALLIGRNMVKTGCYIETYLFNPPFPSLPLEMIADENLKHGLRLGKNIFTAGLAAVVNRRRQSPEQEDPFVVLSAWIPHLFVNARDRICSQYIRYFEDREEMLASGWGMLGRLAAQNSIRSIISAARGNESEAFHLLPSAYLATNLSPSHDFKQAHGIHQWWKSDVHVEYKLHQFR